MTIQTQTVAAEARAKYEASLATLRNFIASFPAISQRVDEHDERLNALESRFAELRREISSVVSQSAQASKRPSAGTSSAAVSDVSFSETTTKVEITVTKVEACEGNDVQPRLLSGATRTRVSFMDEGEEKEELVSVYNYAHEENDTIMPIHGHWLPRDAIQHRRSFEEARDFTKKLGGRVLKLQPQGIEDVESLECVMVEPMGKILSPAEYVSSGLIVCLDAGTHTSEQQEEWGQVLKTTQWLDSGISFALPDVSELADPADLELVVEAVLKQGGFKTCVLAGKGWGAQIASEVAARSRLSEQIDGVVLVAPESPVPQECSQIPVPVMLIWAQDDEVSPFNEIRDWYEVLGDRRAPTYVKDLENGGHDLTKLLVKETAAQVSYFSVSCLLLALVVQAQEQAEMTSQPIRLSEACNRLCDELPPFLATAVGGEAEKGLAAAFVSSQPDRVERRLQRLVVVLREWIQEGMKEMASATE